ncbi:hypothetical protein DID75_04825 [Candidatus Marinamargulisbacteria bacterium SCGC AG-410-N11]|nr:hypothetical protein DID75_04825 [Candidatus Marinamargulisbacteria bacterium SCGC AG-410-N11]
MGCCGHDFTSEESISLAIKSNTKDFNKLKPKTKQDYLKFRDRFPKQNLQYGVCRNLIYQNRSRHYCIGCPLHPTHHHDEDLRIGHCDHLFLCPSAKAFNQWQPVTQQAFLDFVKKKELSNIQYSIEIASGNLVNNFIYQ